MRVPIPVVILLVLTVVGGMWWKYTRHQDFMTPPTAERLEEIRVRIKSSFPQMEMGDAISVHKVVEPPPPPPPPAIDLGDLTVPPVLDGYADRAGEGANALIELARKLEEKGEFQRALLAWERVLDTAKPDEPQMTTAISSIRRLRPTLPDWNLKPESAISIELHAGTGKPLAKELEPILESVARDLMHASSGVITVKPIVTAGKASAKKGPLPVALWLTGPGKDAVSTDVLSFTVDAPAALQNEVVTTVFQLVRSHLAKSPNHSAPGLLAEGESPMDALGTRVTRLQWSAFGTALNVVPQKKED
ncbi:MAG: hypothetical protein V4640_07290 [Verrucomicrobiota bacterium]